MPRHARSSGPKVREINARPAQDKPGKTMNAAIEVETGAKMQCSTRHRLLRDFPISCAVSRATALAIRSTETWP